MITTAPEKIPPVPNPATALPTIRATLVGATPHSKEPISKIQMAVMKVALICSLN
jgi:hypothetical protein